jgi:hypothetical protein
MTVKTITHPVTGQTVKFGRRRPIARGPRLELKNYLTRALPPAPTMVDYSSAAMPSLSNVYVNDRLGCCTVSGVAHLVGVFTGNAGSCVTFSDDDIIKMYSAVSGYVPGKPSTDQGADEVTVLNYWQQSGIAGAHQINGWVMVDPSDVQEYKAAIWLFESLYFGIELPDAWISPFPSASGFTWDKAGAPDPQNGHCVVATGFTPDGVNICTWGMQGLMTDAAIQEYAAASAGGQLSCMLSLESIMKATQKAPSGFDWTQLVADLQAIGGVVTPQPNPPPPPPPAPNGSLTLQGAQDAVSAAISSGYALMTQGQAIATANAALAVYWGS